MFEQLLIPEIGSRPIADICCSGPAGGSPQDRGSRTHETAHRVKQLPGRVIRFAVATGRATRDPTNDLRGALAPVVMRNHAIMSRSPNRHALGFLRSSVRLTTTCGFASLGTADDG